MYSFKNDYSEGAHINILNKLAETNHLQQTGYGEDDFSLSAKELIKQKIKNREAEIYFLSGGTQTNLIVISSLLKVHEAVISAKTGHIYANETGAIEAVGHKIIAVESEDGKLNPQHIEDVLKDYSLRPHVVKPKLVYISNSSEVGTIYKKTELKALYEYCQSKALFLFLDGARLGHAIMAEDSDLEISDIAAYTDVFYIGGTKNGALFGEAAIFKNKNTAPDFDYVLKQKGALLAKGRVLGIQFLELFRDDLYLSLAKHANTMALRITNAIREGGFSFLSQSTTNQIFPIFPNFVIDKLKHNFDFYIWKVIDDETSAVRLITSWATEEKMVDDFISTLKDIK